MKTFTSMTDQYLRFTLLTSLSKAVKTISNSHLLVRLPSTARLVLDELVL
jgi:hypothetical protein